MCSYMLGAEQLARTLLPVGEMTKGEVRERRGRARAAHRGEAREHGCVLHHRGGRGTFLGARIPRRPGRIVDTAGTDVGTHDGIDAFTIGQRRGVNVAVGERRYVVDIDPDTALVTVGAKPALLRDRVRLRDLQFSARSSRLDARSDACTRRTNAGAARRRRHRVRDAAATRCAGPGRRVLRRRHLLRRGDCGGVTLTADDATRLVQRAIDGGGHVRLEPGTHVVRTLQLRSGLTLEIPKGTTLLAHPDNNAFDLQERLPYQPFADMETSDFAHAMLAGRDLESVSIVGEGTIDMARSVRWGPKPIALKQCRNVRVEGITIVRSPNYCVSLGACDGVAIESVTIRDALSDGIDPDSCRRVRIVNCDVESDDDAICVKASYFLGAPRTSEDIEVFGCRTRSGTNGFKIGTETSGPIRRVLVRDCTFDARPRDDRDEQSANLHDLNEAGGVSIQTVDGGDVENVTIDRVAIQHTRGAISLRRGARGRAQDEPRPGFLRDVILRDITAIRCRETSSIVGLPDALIERVALERVRIEVEGGGAHDGAPVPELPNAYPQNTMFGRLPAWGLSRAPRTRSVAARMRLRRASTRHARRHRHRRRHIQLTLIPRPPARVAKAGALTTDTTTAAGFSIVASMRPRRRPNVTSSASSSSTPPRSAPKRKSSAPGTVAPGTRCRSRIACRRTSTGSTSVIGSTIAMPAGTSTAHRRASGCSARTTSTDNKSPTMVPAVPTTNTPFARSRMLTIGNAMIAIATGIGPKSNGVGIRSGKRTSSPYASALAARTSTGADSASAAAAPVPTIASTNAPVVVDDNDNNTVTTPSGATMRNKVRPHGRGANSASNPPAQASHNNASAVHAGAVFQPAVASESAVPAVTGSSAQTMRAHHSQIAGDIRCSHFVGRSKEPIS